MNIEEYYWICPNCGQKVKALQQLVDSTFEEEGEASFSVGKNGGLYFHTIICTKCNAEWIVSITSVQ